jgi:hypothetical protein
MCFFTSYVKYENNGIETGQIRGISGGTGERKYFRGLQQIEPPKKTL